MAREVIRKVAGQTWHVDADFVDLLFPPGDPAPMTALAQGSVQPVKVGQGRQVLHARIGDQAFYIKEYTQTARSQSHVCHEWKTANWSWRSGLPTPLPVAACWVGGAYLVTIDSGGRNLSDLILQDYFEPAPAEPPYPGHRPPEWVRLHRRRRPRPTGDAPGPAALARMLADMIAALHRLNLRHRDLHPGNLLLVGQGDQRHLEILDLLELEQMPGRKTILEHLVQLNHFFEPLATRTERLRVLKHLDLKGLRFLGLAEKIECLTWRYRRNFYRSRDRRCLRPSKYFSRVEVGPLSGYAVADWKSRLPNQASQFAAALEIVELFKNSSGGQAGFGHLDGQQVFIKRDTGESWRRGSGPWPKIVEDLLRGTRQKRAWVKANMLMVRGIGTARPLVWLDRRHGLAGREGFFVSEALIGSSILATGGPAGSALPSLAAGGWLPLDQALPQLAGGRRAAMIETLAREIRRMHEAGLSHRDLKAQNIMVQEAAGRWRMALVDMDGVRRHFFRAGRRRRTRDLMRLAFSWSEGNLWGAKGLHQTDALRFLKEYLGHHLRQTITLSCRKGRRAAEIDELRRWWHDIMAALDAKSRGKKR